MATASITAVKTLRALQASATNTAGSTTTGTAFDLTTKVGPHHITATIVNGGTGPTVACDFVVEVSADNSTFYEYSRQTAGVTASTTYTFNVPLSGAIMYVRSKFVGNTAQSVTVLATMQECTSLLSTY
jgi:hypothetical protein